MVRGTVVTLPVHHQDLSIQRALPQVDQERDDSFDLVPNGDDDGERRPLFDAAQTAAPQSFASGR